MTLAGTISAQDVIVRGDYRSRDTAGSVVQVFTTWTTSAAEIVTADDNDTILIAAAVTLSFVVRVARGDDDVTMGAGNDLVYGGFGVDILRGNDGNDLLDAGSGIGDQLYGGAGNDYLYGSDDGSETDPDFTDATRFGDLIDGGDGNDTIFSYGGADLVIAGVGQDVITSGAGSDRVLAGAGDDTVYAGPGLADYVEGGLDNDLIHGSDVGNDTLLGQDGEDRIYGYGGNDTIAGGAANDWIDGGAGNDILDGGLGNDWISGSTGNDTLDGSDGDDYLDGSYGTDLVRGGAGNDELYAGNGTGDQLLGGDGDDILYGSQDGADFIHGEAGNDRAFGYAGNDQLQGGPGDDVLEGGDGDDTLYGDAGSDLLLGGAHHDVIYTLNPTNTGADNSVDHAYGDFGTNTNEPNSGRDLIYGANGNSLLYGEGDDDRITVTNPAAFVYYGSGESTVPFDFVAPSPTPNPTLQSEVPPVYPFGTASLPTGPVDRGLWSELSGSASGTGLADLFNSSIDYSMALSASGPIVAWSDNRNGNPEIYVARHNGSAWTALAGSSSLGGVSNTSSNSRHPSVVDAAGKPTVAWIETLGSDSHVRVAQFDATANSGNGAWVALGSSLDANGLSGAGQADSPQLLQTSFGLVVAWLQNVNGTNQIYAKLWNGTAWTALGTGSDTGGGLTSAVAGSQIADLKLASTTGRLAMAYTITVSSQRRVYLRQYNGTVWGSISGSSSGAGVSGAAASLFPTPITHNQSPSITYAGSDLVVAWQTFADQSSSLIVARYTNSTGAPNILVNRLVGARDIQPQVIGNSTTLRLFSLDSYDRLTSLKWNGSAFMEEVPGDFNAPGLFPIGRGVSTYSVAMTATGRPTVLWEEVAQGRGLLKLRTQAALTGRVLTANPTGPSIQQLLDNNVLVPGDVIYVKGTVTGNVSIPAADAGVIIYGAPGAKIVGSLSVAANNVTWQGVDILGGVQATNSNNFTLRDSTVTGTVSLRGGSSAQLFSNTLGSVLLTGNVY